LRGAEKKILEGVKSVGRAGRGDTEEGERKKKDSLKKKKKDRKKGRLRLVVGKNEVEKVKKEA